MENYIFIKCLMCFVLLVSVPSKVTSECSLQEFGEEVAIEADFNYGVTTVTTQVQPQAVECSGDCPSVWTIPDPSQSVATGSCTCCHPSLGLVTEVERDIYIENPQSGSGWDHIEDSNGEYHSFDHCTCQDKTLVPVGVDPWNAHHCRILRNTIFAQPGRWIRVCWTKKRPTIKPSRLQEYRTNMTNFLERFGQRSVRIRSIPLSPDVITDEKYTPQSWNFPRSIFRRSNIQNNHPAAPHAAPQLPVPITNE